MSYLRKAVSKIVSTLSQSSLSVTARNSGTDRTKRSGSEIVDSAVSSDVRATLSNLKRSRSRSLNGGDVHRSARGCARAFEFPFTRVTDCVVSCNHTTTAAISCRERVFVRRRFIVIVEIWANSCTRRYPKSSDPGKSSPLFAQSHRNTSRLQRDRRLTFRLRINHTKKSTRLRTQPPNANSSSTSSRLVVGNSHREVASRGYKS